MDGASLLPVLRDPNQSSRKSKPVSISRWFNGESARNERYRYTRWQDEAGHTLDHMLFDLTLNPGETRNIVADPEVASVVAELSRELDLNGGNTTWSEEMKRRVSRTARFNFPFSEYVIAATFYPIRAGLIALILVALTAGGVWLAVSRIIQVVRR